MNNYFQNFKEWIGNSLEVSDNESTVLAAFVIILVIGLLFLAVFSLIDLLKDKGSVKTLNTKDFISNGRVAPKFDTDNLQEAVTELVQKNYGLKTSEIVELLECGGFEWRTDQQEHREAAILTVLSQIAARG